MEYLSQLNGLVISTKLQSTIDKEAYRLSVATSHDFGRKSRNLHVYVL